MRKLSEKEEDFLVRNPIVVGTVYRRFRSRKDAPESIEAEARRKNAKVSASHVRNLCQEELGDFVIDYEATEQYKKDAIKHKEFIKEKRRALELGDKKLLKSLVEGRYSDDDEEDEDLEALREEYKEVVGKKPHHKMKADKLQEKIDEAKAESKED